MTQTALEQVDSALSQVAIEEKIFELAQRKAAIYAKSSLVPKEYQNNIGNVLIAENMARRMGADTLMVMQNLYVVHGKPGWSATFLIASFNSNGRFSAIKYRFSGEPNTPEWGCQAYCTEIATGEEINGTTITYAMATAEGWVNKAGSKWKTMPEQMFRYRAATFLIRSTAPEIGMGLLTKEELEDMPSNGTASTAELKPGVAGIKDRLKLVEETTPDGLEAVEAEIIASVEDQMAEVAEELREADEIERSIESQLEDLKVSAKDKINQLTGGEARAVGNLLNGRTPNTMDMKQIKAFHKELDKLIDAQG